MARVGIFSGTFDPVHTGHIAFCRAARAEAELDKIVLLPEPEPRGKEGVAPVAHRRTMLELAVQGDAALAVLQLPDKRFTVADTLPRLQERFRGDELYLLAGSDVVRSLERGWPGQERLLVQMRLIIGLRAGDTRRDIARRIAAIARRLPDGVPFQPLIVGSPYAALASTPIRTGGIAGAAHVAPAVAAYIATHQLYATPA